MFNEALIVRMGVEDLWDATSETRVLTGTMPAWNDHGDGVDGRVDGAAAAGRPAWEWVSPRVVQGRSGPVRP